MQTQFFTAIALLVGGLAPQAVGAGLFCCRDDDDSSRSSRSEKYVYVPVKRETYSYIPVKTETRVFETSYISAVEDETVEKVEKAGKVYRIVLSESSETAKPEKTQPVPVEGTTEANAATVKMVLNILQQTGALQGFCQTACGSTPGTTELPASKYATVEDVRTIVADSERRIADMLDRRLEKAALERRIGELEAELRRLRGERPQPLPAMP